MTTNPLVSKDRPEDPEEPEPGQPATRQKLYLGVKRAAPAAAAVLALAGLTVVTVQVLTHHSPAPKLFASEPRHVAVSPAASTQVNPSSGSTAAGTNHRAIPPTQLASSGGALPLPKDMRVSVRRWDAGPGGADLARISTDYGDVTQAGAIMQYTTMRYACGHLAAGVAAARAGPPIPDLAMRQLYAAALADLVKGANDCRAAISVSPDGDESTRTVQRTRLLRRSMLELVAGSKDLFRATAEIEIVSRR